MTTTSGRMTGRLRPALLALPTAAILAALGGCKRTPAATTPAAPAETRTRRSASGAFVATITPEKDPIPVNQIHSWRLHLATPDGRPIEKAVINVDGLMPEHSHGMATQPRVTRHLGGGTYLVEGFKLQMLGRWTIRFTVTTDRIWDEDVFFDVVLD